MANSILQEFMVIGQDGINIIDTEQHSSDLNPIIDESKAIMQPKKDMKNVDASTDIGVTTTNLSHANNITHYTDDILRDIEDIKNIDRSKSNDDMDYYPQTREGSPPSYTSSHGVFDSMIASNGMGLMVSPKLSMNTTDYSDGEPDKKYDEDNITNTDVTEQDHINFMLEHRCNTIPEHQFPNIFSSYLGIHNTANLSNDISDVMDDIAREREKVYAIEFDDSHERNFDDSWDGIDNDTQSSGNNSDIDDYDIYQLRGFGTYWQDTDSQDDESWDDQYDISQRQHNAVQRSAHQSVHHTDPSTANITMVNGQRSRTIPSHTARTRNQNNRIDDAKLIAKLNELSADVDIIKDQLDSLETTVTEIYEDQQQILELLRSMTT